MAQVTPKPNGRPCIRAYDNLSKPCKVCGQLFYLRDRKFQSLSKFNNRRFCSIMCSQGRTSPYNGPNEFWAKVEKTGADDCWRWTGKISQKGYGCITYQGSHLRAHRLAYTLATGPITDGMMILHSCDNRACCNPAHLREGTAKDNVADAVSRNRMNWQKQGIAA